MNSRDTEPAPPERLGYPRLEYTRPGCLGANPRPHWFQPGGCKRHKERERETGPKREKEEGDLKREIFAN